MLERAYPGQVITVLAVAGGPACDWERGELRSNFCPQYPTLRLKQLGDVEDLEAWLARGQQSQPQPPPPPQQPPEPQPEPEPQPQPQPQAKEQSHPASIQGAAELAAAEGVTVGLGRIVASYCRSSTSYQNR